MSEKKKEKKSPPIPLPGEDDEEDCEEGEEGCVCEIEDDEPPTLDSKPDSKPGLEDDDESCEEGDTDCVCEDDDTPSKPELDSVCKEEIAPVEDEEAPIKDEKAPIEEENAPIEEEKAPIETCPPPPTCPAAPETARRPSGPHKMLPIYGDDGKELTRPTDKDGNPLLVYATSQGRPILDPKGELVAIRFDDGGKPIPYDVLTNKKKSTAALQLPQQKKSESNIPQMDQRKQAPQLQPPKKSEPIAPKLPQMDVRTQAPKPSHIRIAAPLGDNEEEVEDTFHEAVPIVSTQREVASWFLWLTVLDVALSLAIGIVASVYLHQHMHNSREDHDARMVLVTTLAVSFVGALTSTFIVVAGTPNLKCLFYIVTLLSFLLVIPQAYIIFAYTYDVDVLYIIEGAHCVIRAVVFCLASCYLACDPNPDRPTSRRSMIGRPSQVGPAPSRDGRVSTTPVPAAPSITPAPTPPPIPVLVILKPAPPPQAQNNNNKVQQQLPNKSKQLYPVQPQLPQQAQQNPVIQPVPVIMMHRYNQRSGSFGYGYPYYGYYPPNYVGPMPGGPPMAMVDYY